jgi:putative ABC transport system substrate-binding protein
VLDVRRRDFITLLGGAAAWPLAARAQQPAMPVVGFLRNSSRDDSVELLAAMRQGLKQTGYIEGKNLAIEYRFADNHFDRLPGLVTDLVRRQVAVIIAGGNASSLAAKAATTRIPIVFSTGDDPVQIGLVSNLGRPGGNVTGVSFLSSAALAAKRIDVMHQLMPKVVTLAYLSNPNNPVLEHELREVRTAAEVLGLQILVVSVGSEGDLEPALVGLAREPAVALLVAGDSLFSSLRDRLVALAARQALPTMYYLREYAAAGGLISYGASITEAYRQAGIYASGILKGASPADLPVVLPTKFELVINLTTAKAFGLDVPLSLLIRADELLE